VALIVIDASVVIALLDPADPLHASARREFDQVAGEELALPASALAETLVAPARASKLEGARQRIQALEFVIAAGAAGTAVCGCPTHRFLQRPKLLNASLLLIGDANWAAIVVGSFRTRC